MIKSMDNETIVQIVKNIQTELKNYIIKSNLKSLIIGISGGIDSAFCSVLAKPVCDDLKIPLLGYSIPIETNKKDEIDRAKSIGKLFCTKFCEVDLTKAFENLCSEITIFDNDKGGNRINNKSKSNLKMKYKIRLGNLKARLRMIFLMHQASLENGMVLSTDNFSEYLLGFWTLHGDAGDYGMVQYLYKSEVYDISNWLMRTFKNNNEDYKADALKKCIDAIPTDGLGITEGGDLAQIKAKSYQEVDKILISYKKGDLSLEEHPVIIRYNRTWFKRNNPYNQSRQSLFKGTINVEDVPLFTKLWKKDI